MCSVRMFVPMVLTLIVSSTLFAQSASLPAERQRQIQQLQSQQRSLQQSSQPVASQAAGGQPAQGQPLRQRRSAQDQSAELQAAQTPAAQTPAAQTPAAQTPAAQTPAGQAGPQAPQAPFQLTPAQQKRLDQLLTYWETRSGKVKTYSCDFTRMEYDSVFGPKNPKWPKMKSEGIIRFSAPDKGEFHVEKIGKFQPPAAQGETPLFPMQKDEAAEHWICNGQAVFELNGKKKQLIERQLPKEMQGKQITDGPLPFMFGAKKDKLMRRYWIQELTPPANRKGEYWLEAYPRLAENAAEFQRIRVILDEKTFLPNALEIYPPNYNARTNTSRTVYLFESRRVNDPLHRGQEFFGRFISPKTPRGWKKIVENFNGPAAPPSVANAIDAPGRPPGQAAAQKR